MIQGDESDESDTECHSRWRGPPRSSEHSTETCPCNADRGCDCDCYNHDGDCPCACPCNMEAGTYTYKREPTTDELLQQKAHLQSRLQSIDDEYRSMQGLTALVKEQNMLEAMLQKDPTDPTRLIPIPADSPERLARLAQLQTEIDSRRWQPPSFSHAHRKTILDEIADIDRILERSTVAATPPSPQHCQCLIQ